LISNNKEAEMKTIEQIGIIDLKEHLIKNWMTHDGMWFYHCLASYGIDEANRLNKAAIRSLAAIEFRRALQLFGISRVETFEDLKGAVDAVFSVSKGDFMKFTYTFPEKNLSAWEFDGDGCFAYHGLKRMGAVDRYECGVIYRVLCWLENAGARYEVVPEFKGCLMHETGQCSGSIRLHLPWENSISRGDA
jgi:hypothetical protein